jgi:hypothetical protein
LLPDVGRRLRRRTHAAHRGHRTELDDSGLILRYQAADGMRGAEARSAVFVLARLMPCAAGPRRRGAGPVWAGQRLRKRPRAVLGGVRERERRNARQLSARTDAPRAHLCGAGVGPGTVIARRRQCPPGTWARSRICRGPPVTT